MKALRFLLVAVSLLCVIPCFGKRVKLKGMWNSKRKSIEMNIPITATVEEKNRELSLSFQEDLGLVYVTIYNSLGEVVYDEAVQTADNSFITISLTDVSDENGVISITDGMNLVEGEFSIQ